MVSKWAADGVPLKVAFRGIDRLLQARFKKALRQLTVRIDFCEPAHCSTYLTSGRRALRDVVRVPGGGGRSARDAQGRVVAAHLERVVLQLTQARVAGTFGPGADALLDPRVSGI